MPIFCRTFARLAMNPFSFTDTARLMQRMHGPCLLIFFKKPPDAQPNPHRCREALPLFFQETGSLRMCRRGKYAKIFIKTKGGTHERLYFLQDRQRGNPFRQSV